MLKSRLVSALSAQIRDQLTLTHGIDRFCLLCESNGLVVTRWKPTPSQLARAAATAGRFVGELEGYVTLRVEWAQQHVHHAAS